MIREIRLRNFKCFADLALPLGPLTLLSGVNGMGKSSVLQSLLLLRQSLQQGLLERGRLALNGDLVSVGTARDALYSDAEEDHIGLEVAFASGAAVAWDFRYDRDADVLFTEPSTAAPAARVPLDEGLFGAHFQYLCAERVGPRTAFPMSEFVVRQQRQLGPRGEYTTHFLSVFGEDKVTAPALHHPNATGASLLAQVEAWLDVISPGTRLKLTAHAALDLVQLQYEFVHATGVSAPFRPTNVGFGLTYTLPVLVALLSAPPGALLLLENPEAHLHPRGQARMGQLIALAAGAGVQVALETHSDHVLNGIRLAVHDGQLAPDAVRLHFFARRDAAGRSAHEVVSPAMDADGRVDHWPEGFFDEWDQALDRLLRPAAAR